MLIKKDTVNELTYSLYCDTTSENPVNEFDLFGTFVNFNRRYTIGHENVVYGTFDDYMEDYISEDDLYLPVYGYDHGGLTIATNPFNCAWDSGLIGLIRVDKKEALKEFDTEEEALSALKSTIRIIDQWLTGNVYGYVVENSEGENIDSCWGFYFDDAEEMEDYVINAVLPFI